MFIVAFWLVYAAIMAGVVFVGKPKWAKSEDESQKKGKFVPNFVGLLVTIIVSIVGLIGSLFWYFNYANEPDYYKVH